MTTDYQEPEAEVVPGVRLGLPASGPGSVATYGRRLLGVVIDIAASYAIAALLAGTATPGGWSTLVFLVETVVLLSLTGQTLGMAAVRVRVLSLSRGRIHAWWALIRQLLLLAMIPALVTDADRRGLHDKASGVVVVNA
ncbi:MAG: hypothetical protein QOI76_1730 [Frankiales bacterium]|nr:hypothetical protein [Frankiales bacterium]